MRVRHCSLLGLERLNPCKVGWGCGGYSGNKTCSDNPMEEYCKNIVDTNSTEAVRAYTEAKRVYNEAGRVYDEAECVSDEAECAYAEAVRAYTEAERVFSEAERAKQLTREEA